MKRRGKNAKVALLLSAALVSTNVCYVCAQEQPLSDAGSVSGVTGAADTSAVLPDRINVGSTSNAADTNQAGEAKEEQSNQAGQNGTEQSGTSQTETPKNEQPGTNQTEEPKDGQTGTNQTEESKDGQTGTDQTEEPKNDQTGTDQTEESGKEQTDQTGEEKDGQTDQEGTDGDTTQTPDDDKPDTDGENTETDSGTGEDAENPDASEETGEETDDTAGTDQTEEESPEQTFINKDGEEVIPSTLVGVDYNTIAGSYDGEINTIKQYVVSDEYEKDTIVKSYIDENGNLVIVISQGPDDKTEEQPASPADIVAELFSLDTSLSGTGSAPAVDGSFTGWDDVPATYEFNWNKPDAWVDGVHYTETNSTDVRHEMKLYTDGESVYLRVVFAREFCNGQVANGNDYQFWIDNEQMAAYQVEWPNGSSLSYNSAEPGVYVMDVRHRDSSWSYVLTDGAVAYYRVNEGNLNNELELKIPLSEFVKQNGNINLDNYSMISFFTPNLMQDKISVAGASTGAEPFAAAAFLLVPAGYIWIKKKDDKEDMAFA